MPIPINAVPGEQFFASITVTDLTSKNKVASKHRHSGSSLPTMLYMESEINHFSNEIGEFQFSEQFIDDYFDSDSKLPLIKKIDRDSHFDFLLGIQSWRRFISSDLQKAKTAVNTGSTTTLQKLKI